MLEQESLNSFFDITNYNCSLDKISSQEINDSISFTNTDFFINSDTIANDTPATSTLLNSYNGTKTLRINDSVGNIDPADYFKITITSQAIYNFSVSGIDPLTSNLSLYASNGTTLISSVNTPTNNLYTIDKELLTGTYYIKVASSSANDTNYSLTISAKPIGIWSELTGYGQVNAASALAKATNSLPFPSVANLNGRQSFLDIVNAPEAWAKGYTGKGVIVAVIDTGLDINHPYFAGKIWNNEKEIAGNGIDDDANGYIDDVNGWNFSGLNNNVFDDNNHGTHVAGIINQVALDAKIMPIKSLNSSGFGGISFIAKGIVYAANNGANVINLSLGGSLPTNILLSAIKYATSKGSVVVMAAGNSGSATPIYPAAYANQYGIAVGAGNPSWSSKSGPSILDYVTAPGSGIYSALPNNRWGSKSGTSMSAPIVAGIAALLKSANNSLTPSQIEDLITSTAKNRTIAAPSAPLPPTSSNVSLGVASIDIPPTYNNVDRTSTRSFYQFNESFKTPFIQFSFEQKKAFETYEDSLNQYDYLTGERKEISKKLKK